MSQNFLSYHAGGVVISSVLIKCESASKEARYVLLLDMDPDFGTEKSNGLAKYGRFAIVVYSNHSVSWISSDYRSTITEATAILLQRFTEARG